MLALICMQAEDDGQGSCPGHVVALADHGRDQAFILQRRECPFGRDVRDAVLLAERLDAR